MKLLYMVTVLFVFLSCSNPGTGSNTDASDGAVADDDGSLLVLTENFPPYNYPYENSVTGICTDILREVLKHQDISYSVDDIKLMTWSGAYRTVQERKNTMLFSMSRTAEREEMFVWIGPVVDISYVLMARTDNNIRISDFSELQNYRIGTVQDDVGEQILAKMGIDEDSLDRVLTPDLNARKLDLGRIDLWMYDRIAAFWILNNEGFDTGEFQPVMKFDVPKLYFAFNKRTDTTIIQAFETSLREVKTKRTAAGTLLVDEIISAYIE